MKDIDNKLLFSIFSIIIFGWIMVLSASYTRYEFSLFIKQGFFILTGISIGLFIIKRISISWFKANSNILYFLMIVALVMVFLPIDGNKVNGSIRWINFNIIGLPFKLQPSEIAKLVMIIAVARLINNQAIHSVYGTLKTAGTIIPVAMLLLLETDFGATILISITAFSMVFVAGTEKKPFIILIILMLVFLGVAIYFNENRLDRILAFISGDGIMDEQREQALLGIVRGDWLGSGIGGGLQKISKLAESHTDMIFAVTGEETGVTGMLSLFLLFIFIVYRGFAISRVAICKNRIFHSSLAFGISFWLAIQVMLNLSVNLSLIPPKGVTLPLVSYGGSSIIFAIISLAILLKIDIENKQRKINE